MYTGNKEKFYHMHPKAMMATSYSPTNTFLPAVSALPPQLSMVTETTGPSRFWPLVKESSPQKFTEDLWSYNLQSIFASHPRGLSVTELQELFYKEYDTVIIPTIFGFHTIEELLKSIHHLVHFAGIYKLD